MNPPLVVSSTSRATDDPGGDERAQRGADAPLAPLVAIVDRGVDDVEAALDGAHDGIAIGSVGGGVLIAEIGAETHR